ESRPRLGTDSREVGCAGQRGGQFVGACVCVCATRNAIHLLLPLQGVREKLWVALAPRRQSKTVLPGTERLRKSRNCWDGLWGRGLPRTGHRGVASAWPGGPVTLPVATTGRQPPSITVRESAVG